MAEKPPDQDSVIESKPETEESASEIDSSPAASTQSTLSESSVEFSDQDSLSSDSSTAVSTHSTDSDSSVDFSDKDVLSSDSSPAVSTHSTDSDSSGDFSDKDTLSSVPNKRRRVQPPQQKAEALHNEAITRKIRIEANDFNKDIAADQINSYITSKRVEAILRML